MAYPTYYQDISGNLIFAGGKTAGSTLWLSSTSHLTKGTVRIGSATQFNYDQVNSLLTLERDSLATLTGAGGTHALLVTNETLTTVGAQQQNSPSLTLRGHGWHTGLTTDKNVSVVLQNRPIAASPPTASLYFGFEREGAAFVDVMVLKASGSYLLNGFASLGSSLSDPANTTLGDLTSLRAHIGTDAAFTTGMGFEINAALMTQGGTIATQSFSPVYGALFAPTLTGALVDLVGVGVSPVFRPANNPPNWVMGLRSLPMVDPPNAVTVPSAYGWALGLQTGSTAGGAINVTTGVLISMVYGTQKPATAYGLTISDVGSAGITNAVALNIVKPTGSTNNYYAAFDTADATVMAVAGRLPVSVGGVLHYLLYG